MTAVVFDLGNVLIVWDPRLLLSEAFIAETEFYKWNTELDRGASFAETVATMRAQFPHHAEEFDLFRDNWTGTLGPVFEYVVDAIDSLKARGIPVYALTNSSAETLPRSPVVQEILTKFDGVVVSGEVGLVKPDFAIFEYTEQRFGLDRATTWFIDDSKANIEAADSFGWNAIYFTGPASLEPLLDLEA